LHYCNYYVPVIISALPDFSNISLLICFGNRGMT
jgi:hypothetical protein